MRGLLAVLLLLIALVVFLWLGLRVRPAPFPPLRSAEEPLPSFTLPESLPTPVERFYRELYGNALPQVETAVVSGRASLRIAGVTFPARFRFSYLAGQGYRHYIEATLFGFPVMRVNEAFLGGEARLELPFGVTEGEPKVDQAANLGLWAETIWFPTAYLRDERVSWESVDEETAILEVPFDDDEQRFVVRFDPESGLVRFFESMRYKDVDSATKSLWLNEVWTWGQVDGWTVPAVVALTWFEDGRPWAVFEVEEVAYGVAVDDDLRISSDH